MKREHRLPSGVLVVSERVVDQRWYQMHGPFRLRDVGALAEIATREAEEIADEKRAAYAADIAAIKSSS